MRRPPSGWLRTSSSAPCAVLTDWAIDRPRPTPPPLLPIRRNGSVSVGTASAGTSAPLLAMVRTTPFAQGPVITRIQPPGSLCRTALSTRFQTIRSMSCWSPVVSAGESSVSTLSPSRVMPGAASSRASSATADRSSSSRLATP